MDQRNITTFYAIEIKRDSSNRLVAKLNAIPTEAERNARIYKER